MYTGVMNYLIFLKALAVKINELDDVFAYVKSVRG